MKQLIETARIEDEIKKAKILHNATQQLICMQSSEAVQVNRFTDKFNYLISSLQNATGLPQKCQKISPEQIKEHARQN